MLASASQSTRLSTLGVTVTGGGLKLRAVNARKAKETLPAAFRRIFALRPCPHHATASAAMGVVTGSGGMAGGVSGGGGEGGGSEEDADDAAMIAVGGLKAADQQNSSRDWEYGDTGCACAA
jgi:hypothetical protein